MLELMFDETILFTVHFVNEHMAVTSMLEEEVPYS